jgi:hypothetical protein
VRTHRRSSAIYRSARLKESSSTTDAYIFYRKAVEESFGADIDFAQLTKLYGDYGQFGDERYSPPRITEVISKVRQGDPDPKHISTSYVERQNLTMRMHLRRLTRLKNAFSSHRSALCALQFLPCSLVHFAGHAGDMPQAFRNFHLEHGAVICDSN